MMIIQRSLATILDPRFKLHYCTTEDKTTLQEKIIAEGKVVARRIEESVAPTSTESSETSQQVVAPANKKDEVIRYIKLKHLQQQIELRALDNVVNSVLTAAVSRV